MSSNKILFITHLAIGDFIYMQPYFKKLAKTNPDFKIDICVDESRCKPFILFKKQPKINSVIDWIKNLEYFNEIFQIPYDKKAFNQFVDNCKEEKYKKVISLGTIRSHRYNYFARQISADGFVIGIKSKQEKYNKLLNLTLRANKPNHHVTELYADWFEKIFNLKLTKEEIFPTIDIPLKWLQEIKEKFFYTKNVKSIFINSFASNAKRSWPIKNVLTLISNLNKNPLFLSSKFIINIPPENNKLVNELTEKLQKNVILFTANKNFFELPAMVANCSFVISVETSTMHIAQALKIPQIALMRSKSPDWKPYTIDENRIIFAPDNKKIKDISIEEVEKKLKDYFHE